MSKAAALVSAVALWCAAVSVLAHNGRSSAPVQPQDKDVFDIPREFTFRPPELSPSALGVLSWNLDGGLKTERIGSELEQRIPELCLLQEVDWNTARAKNRDIAQDLGRRLRLNVVYGVEFEELGQERSGAAYIGQATLTSLPVRTSRILRFERQSAFWNPRLWLPSSMALFQRRRGGRLALVTELEFAGRPLVVYNVHLESRSMGSIQFQQLDEILSDLERYPAGTPIVVAGDLNSEYFPSVMLHHLERAGFHSVLGEQIVRTHRIAMSLDWIFIRGPLQVQNGGVQRGWKGSDHFPLGAELVAR